MRLLAGLVAGFDWETELVGDASLSARPMDRVAEPLGLMGATVAGHGARCLPPLLVRGGGLHGIDWTSKVVSAQVKSAIILAGLSAEGTTIVREAVTTRTHTEEMLLEAGADLTVEPWGEGRIVRVRASSLEPVERIVPGDPSASAFFAVAGCVVPGQRRRRCRRLQRTGSARLRHRPAADGRVRHPRPRRPRHRDDPGAGRAPARHGGTGQRDPLARRDSGPRRRRCRRPRERPSSPTSASSGSRRSTGSSPWRTWSRPSAPTPRSTGTPCPSPVSAVRSAAPASTARATTGWRWRQPWRRSRPVRVSAASSPDSARSRPATRRSPRTWSGWPTARRRRGRCWSPSTGRPEPASRPSRGRWPSDSVSTGSTPAPCTGRSPPSPWSWGRRPTTTTQWRPSPRPRRSRWGSG